MIPPRYTSGTKESRILAWMYDFCMDSWDCFTFPGEDYVAEAAAEEFKVVSLGKEPEPWLLELAGEALELAQYEFDY